MNLLKALIPNWLLKIIRPVYHGLVALLASYYFNQPSKNLIVIGITGTTGKSTTTQMLAKILNTAGKKCGFITTISFFDGDSEQINKHGLSMPGGWLLQKNLRIMKDKGCEYAIVECTSEGLAQNRHWGINFSYALFTNLSEAHIKSHGSWKNYKAAKGKLFASLGLSKGAAVEKTIVANLDDPSAGLFLSFPAARKIGVSCKGVNMANMQKIYQAKITENGFELGGQNFNVYLLGEFNKHNGALAAATAESLSVSFPAASKALNEFKAIPGRMEEIENTKGVRVIVDYGCEPASFAAALKAASALPHKRLIHVFGSTGGHRDSQKRFVFGRTSAQYADEIVITNDDVYDSDPEKIAADIKLGTESEVGSRKSEVRIILDRREAIKYALSIARMGDLVLITGKGSEQFLVLPGNKRISWDDREAVRQELSIMN